MANSSRDAVDNQSRGISEAEQAAAKAVRTAINTKKAVKTVKIVKKYGFKGILDIFKKGLKKSIKDLAKAISQVIITGLTGIIILVIVLALFVCVLMPLAMICDDSVLTDQDAEAKQYASLMHRIENEIGDESFAEQNIDSDKESPIAEALNGKYFRDENGRRIKYAYNSKDHNIKYDLKNVDVKDADDSDVIVKTKYDDEADGDYDNEYSYLTANDRVAIQYIATNAVMKQEDLEGIKDFNDAATKMLNDWVIDDFAIEWSVAIDQLKEGTAVTLTENTADIYTENITVDQDPSAVTDCKDTGRDQDMDGTNEKVCKLEDQYNSYTDPTTGKTVTNVIEAAPLGGTAHFGGTIISTVGIKKIEFRQKDVRKAAENKVVERYSGDYGYSENACDSLTGEALTSNNSAAAMESGACNSKQKKIREKIISEHQNAVNSEVDNINNAITEMYTNIANEVNELAKNGYDIHYNDDIAYGAFTGDAEVVYEYLAGRGLTDFAIAGIMGNAKAESMLRANNAEDGYGYSTEKLDKAYTDYVDDKSTTKEAFCNDRVGYGLFQFTDPTKKRYCYEYTVEKGVSVGDAAGQMDSLFAYMNDTGNNGIWDELNAKTSVYSTTLKWFSAYEFCMPEETIVMNYRQNLETRVKYADDIYNSIQAAKASSSSGYTDDTDLFPFADGSYSIAWVNANFWPVLKQTSKEGAGTYSIDAVTPGHLQCVDVSRYILWKKYHIASAGGNGKDVVSNNYNAHKDLFRITDQLTAGAIFSYAGGGSVFGHTGYINRVSEDGKTIWITEGNISNSISLRVNQKISLSSFYGRGGRNYQYLVPLHPTSSSSSNKTVNKAIKIVKEIAADDSNIYVSGGCGNHRYDCSGFVVACYRMAGVGLPSDHSISTRNMNALCRAGFRKIEGINFATQSGMQPGDILVSPGHATMYLGNGRVVEATNPSAGIQETNYVYNATNSDGYNRNFNQCYRYERK